MRGGLSNDNNYELIDSASDHAPWYQNEKEQQHETQPLGEAENEIKSIQNVKNQEDDQINPMNNDDDKKNVVELPEEKYMPY